MEGRFSIPVKVVNRAAQEGIPLANLRKMVAHSAKITHPDGNRRFHNFLFQVEGGKVLNFKKVDQVAPRQQIVVQKPEKVQKPLQEAPQRPTARVTPMPVRRREPVPEARVYRCSTCQDTHKVMVYDECVHCDGEGCQLCGSTGEVRRYIPCQDCELRGKLRAV